jgi:hypothetical protein
MVHALREIRRVLVKDGIMIDLRPVLDRWPIEVSSSRGIQKTGHFQDASGGLADDVAANQTIALAEHEGWFKRQAEEFFSYIYSWDTPREMEEWIEAEWPNSLRLDNETKQATRSTWVSSNADARVQVRVKMLITRWKVITEP